MKPDWWVDDEYVKRLLDDLSPSVRREVIAAMRRLAEDDAS